MSSKAINSESLCQISGTRDFQSLRICSPVNYNQYVETDNITEGRKKCNMDTKDTAEKTAPSVAPAKPAPAPKAAGEPGPDVP